MRRSFGASSLWLSLMKVRAMMPGPRACGRDALLQHSMAAYWFLGVMLTLPIQAAALSTFYM